MVRLVPMTESEFEIYYKRSTKIYADEHVKAGNWAPEEALQKSEKEFLHHLPDGLASKKQHLFSVVDDNACTKVGMIWFAERIQASKPTAFICDFQIDEEFRKKGYGKQTMVALEEKVKELGIETISLHVFGHNKTAINLYQAIGYQITDMSMIKRIGE